MTPLSHSNEYYNVFINNANYENSYYICFIFYPLALPPFQGLSFGLLSDVFLCNFVVWFPSLQKWMTEMQYGELPILTIRLHYKCLLFLRNTERVSSKWEYFYGSLCNRLSFKNYKKLVHIYYMFLKNGRCKRRKIYIVGNVDNDEWQRKFRNKWKFNFCFRIRNLKLIFALNSKKNEIYQDSKIEPDSDPIKMELVSANQYIILRMEAISPLENLQLIMLLVSLLSI